MAAASYAEVVSPHDQFESSQAGHDAPRPGSADREWQQQKARWIAGAASGQRRCTPGSAGPARTPGESPAPLLEGGATRPEGCVLDGRVGVWERESLRLLRVGVR
jgi:hypothetical protein